MTSYVASTLLMGTLAVLVAIAVVRSRHWYRYAPSPSRDGEVGWSPDHESRPPLLARPTTWIVAFFAVTLLAVGGVLAFVTSPAPSTGLFSMPVLAVAGLLLGSYLLLGVYYAAKGRGHPPSLAAAETAVVFGALFLLGISAQLIG